MYDCPKVIWEQTESLINIYSKWNTAKSNPLVQYIKITFHHQAFHNIPFQHTIITQKCKDDDQYFTIYKYCT